MHLHKKVSVTACTMAVQLAELAAAITVEACLKVASSSGAPDSAAISTVGERVAAVLEELRNIDTVCEVEAPGALMPVERPLLAPFAASQKHFAFFSLIQEIADVLQNDAESRQHDRRVYQASLRASPARAPRRSQSPRHPSRRSVPASRASRRGLTPHAHVSLLTPRMLS